MVSKLANFQANPSALISQPSLWQVLMTFLTVALPRLCMDYTKCIEMNKNCPFRAVEQIAGLPYPSYLLSNWDQTEGWIFFLMHVTSPIPKMEANLISEIFIFFIRKKKKVTAKISHVWITFSSLILHYMLLASLISWEFPPPPCSKDRSLKMLLSNRAGLETYSPRQR